MKDILEPYLNSAVRIYAEYAGMSREYRLFKVEDNYFGVIDSIGNENFYRYIPYSSISEISEKKNTLTIKIYNSDQLMEYLDNIHYTMTEDIETKLDSMKEEIHTLKEETRQVKVNVLNTMVPFGELMRKSSEIKEELNEINKELNEINEKLTSTNQQISSFEDTFRFNSRIK